MTKLWLFCVGLLICSADSVSAGSIRGSITAKDSGEPLAGANIEVTLWWEPKYSENSVLTWLVQKFEIYERDTEGNWQGRVTGDTYPFTRREISYGFPVFRLKVAPGSESTFYARITEQKLAAPMRLWASDAFDRHNLNSQMWNGLIA